MSSPVALMQVDLFYTSNVEPYLFGSGRAEAFYENLAVMPLAPDGISVRSFFGSTARECAMLRPTIRTPGAGPIGPVMAAFRSGGLASQCEFVVLTR